MSAPPSRPSQRIVTPPSAATKSGERHASAWTFAPDAVGEVHELLPVVGGQVVDTPADVVAQWPADQRGIEGGHLVGADGLVPIECVDRRGVGEGEELAAWVG